MNQVPIHLLNAFVTFNESKNINSAAEKLQITQPALSKQLKQLEDFFTLKLFVISGRKKQLTPFGRELHVRLKERLGNIQELLNETLTLHGQSRDARVRIAARRGVLDRISSKLKFDGSIFFRELSNDEIIDSLLNLESEIGIVHNVPNTFELITKPLFKEQFQIVIPKKLLSKKHHFGEQLFSALREIPCLGYRPQDEILRAICAHFSLDLHDLRIIRTTENYQSLAEMVNVGLGWAVLPGYLEVQENKNWTVSIPDKISSARLFSIAYRPEFATVPWFKDLLAEIRACF